MYSFIVASPHLPTVGRAIRCLLEQDAAQNIGEILVAGPTIEPLPSSELVRCLDIDPGPAYAAYNAGIREARGDSIAIIDGDCLLAPDWLSRVMRRHAEGWDVVAGGVEVPRGSYWSTAYNYSGFSEWLTSRRSGPRPALPTMNLSLGRSVAKRTGEVRQDLPRVYDYEWTLRMSQLGYRLYFDAAARARHEPPGVSPRVLWRTWYANGSCSQAVRRAHRDRIHYPRLLDHPNLVKVAAPALAAITTTRVLARDPGALRLWMVAPAVLLTRLAWFLGASAGRRRGPLMVSDYAYQAKAVGSRGYWS